MSVVSPGFTGRGRRSDPSLPPGQYLTEDFPVLSAGPTPRIPLDTWEFVILSEAGQRHAWTWPQLLALPSQSVTVDLHCVTKWSKLGTTWRGVRVSDLLDRAQVKTSGTHVMAHSDGGYTTNIPLEALYDDDVLVTHEYDGKPLEPDHGAPLRLLVPKRYFWKSAKFLRQLEVMPADRQGFWELNGYHNDADPWREERHWF